MNSALTSFSCLAVLSFLSKAAVISTLGIAVALSIVFTCLAVGIHAALQINNKD